MSTPVRVSNSLLSSADERSERPSREERREELLMCPWRLLWALLSTNIVSRSISINACRDVEEEILIQESSTPSIETSHCAVEELTEFRSGSSRVAVLRWIVTRSTTNRYSLLPSKTCTDNKTWYLFCVSSTCGGLVMVLLLFVC